MRGNHHHLFFLYVVLTYIMYFQPPRDKCPFSVNLHQKTEDLKFPSHLHKKHTRSLGPWNTVHGVRLTTFQGSPFSIKMNYKIALGGRTKERAFVTSPRGTRSVSWREKSSAVDTLVPVPQIPNGPHDMQL